MSRQHFNAIAAAFASSAPARTARTARSAWRNTVLATVDELRQFNVNFDAVRFLTASGFEPSELS